MRATSIRTLAMVRRVFVWGERVKAVCLGLLRELLLTVSQKVQILCCAASLAASAYAKHLLLLGIWAPRQFYAIGELFSLPYKSGCLRLHYDSWGKKCRVSGVISGQSLQPATRNLQSVTRPPPPFPAAVVCQIQTISESCPESPRLGAVWAHGGRRGRRASNGYCRWCLKLIRCEPVPRVRQGQ